MLYAVMTLPQEWIISETFFVFVCFQALPWQPVGIWHHCWQPFSSRFLCDPWRHPLWPQSAPLHPSSCCIAISNFILPSNNCTWETVKMAPAVVLYSFVGSAACSGECHTSDLDMATPDAVTLCRPSAFSSLWGRCIVLQPSRLSGVLVSSFSPVPWGLTLCRPSARSHGRWPCVVLQPGPMGVDLVSSFSPVPWGLMLCRWPQPLAGHKSCLTAQCVSGPTPCTPSTCQHGSQPCSPLPALQNNEVVQNHYLTWPIMEQWSCAAVQNDYLTWPYLNFILIDTKSNKRGKQSIQSKVSGN